MEDTFFENGKIEYVITVKIALKALWGFLWGKQYVLEFEVEE